MAEQTNNMTHDVEKPRPASENDAAHSCCRFRRIAVPVIAGGVLGAAAVLLAVWIMMLATPNELATVEVAREVIGWPWPPSSC